MGDEVFFLKGGSISIDGNILNKVIKQLRIRRSIEATERDTATELETVEIVQNHKRFSGVLMVALTDRQLWNDLEDRTFDISAFYKNSAGKTMPAIVKGARIEGDSELASEENVADGIHYEIPFKARSFKLKTPT